MNRHIDYRYSVSGAAKEWLEGDYPENFEVLDIGAGSKPAPGATRAIDITKPWKISESNSLKEYLVANAENIPYADEFFERVISRWAIGPRITGIKVYQELARVTKPGGEVYMSILEFEKWCIPTVKMNLRKTGFRILKVHTSVYKNPFTDLDKKPNIPKEVLDSEDITEYIIHAKKA